MAALPGVPREGRPGVQGARRGLGLSLLPFLGAQAALARLTAALQIVIASGFTGDSDDSYY